MSERDEKLASEWMEHRMLYGERVALSVLFGRIRAEGYAAGLEAGRAAERAAVVAWLNNTRIGASWAIGIEAGRAHGGRKRGMSADTIHWVNMLWTGGGCPKANHEGRVTALRATVTCPFCKRWLEMVQAWSDTLAEEGKGT